MKLFYILLAILMSQNLPEFGLAEFLPKFKKTYYNRLCSFQRDAPVKNKKGVVPIVELIYTTDDDKDISVESFFKYLNPKRMVMYEFLAVTGTEVVPYRGNGRWWKMEYLEQDMRWGHYSALCDYYKTYDPKCIFTIQSVVGWFFLLDDDSIVIIYPIKGGNAIARQDLEVFIREDILGAPFFHPTKTRYDFWSN